MKKGIIFVTMAAVLLLGSSFAFAAPDPQASQQAAINTRIQAVPVPAPDSPVLREAAADRYFQAMPMQSMLDDILPSMTKIMQSLAPSLLPSDMPEKQKKQVMDLIPKLTSKVMNKVFDKDVLEKITREAMVKTCTAEAIDTITKFYTSPSGQKKQKKMKIYMNETTEQTVIYMRKILPELESELIKDIEESLKADDTSCADDSPSKPAEAK
jgi:hypothetical protein